MSPKKEFNIAIVVHGRFHMFDLGLSLIKLGVNVVVFTNYPKWAALRFGLPGEKIKSFSLHGYLVRIGSVLLGNYFWRAFEGLIHSWFGGWAKKNVVSCEPKGGWDAIVGMSGVCEELFDYYKNKNTLLVLHRSSLHIVEQKKILEIEEKKINKKIEKPGDWIVARELREYDKADLIRVPSEYVYQSFLNKGFSKEKIKCIPLGVDLSCFFVDKNKKCQKIARIKIGGRIKVIFVGNFSLQKGARVLTDIVESFSKRETHFTFVGKISSDARFLYERIKNKAKFVGFVAQQKLVDYYNDHDLFILPSVQDGFAVVVPQALACGLPVVVSESTGSKMLIKSGVNGWIVQPNDFDGIFAILDKLEGNRLFLIEFIERCCNSNFSFTWDLVGKQTLDDLICNQKAI